jgi:UDP-glucuronate decarboxylase
MKRILITGGAGFLGSHLCDRLIDTGNEVLCLDNFFTGSKENLIHLIGNPRFELIRHDIINPIYLEVDEIYNLACPASPVHYQHNAIKTIKTNVMGAINTLGMAKRLKAKILQASTSEVYGDPDVHPQREDYWGRVNPIGIRSCYDEGKRAAECLMMDYHRQNSVAVKIARIFNTYGPRMALNDGRVVSNFIIQALRGEDITVYGDGSQTRSFCFVNDMIDGLIRLMATPAEFLGPVNIGNPDEFRIVDLAEMTIRMTNSPSKIVFRPLPQDDPLQRKPDITLAGEMLGWKPAIALEEGLKRTIEYFKQRVLTP